MSVVITAEHPAHPDATALISELDAHLTDLLSVEAGATYSRSLANFAYSGSYLKDLISASESFVAGRMQLGPRWILFGGAYMAFGWLIAAVVMAITIIGLPWARAAFNIAIYNLLPFGSRAVRRALPG